MKATQDGKALKFRGSAEINYMPFAIYPSLGMDEVLEMELYSGEINSSESFEWTNVQNPGTSTGVFAGGTVAFDFGIVINVIDTAGFIVNPRFENLGWLNCDDVISDSLPTSFVSVSVEGNWEGEAAASVYVVLKEINSVLSTSYQDSVFVSPSNLPITYNVTAVAIAVKDGEYYFGTEEKSVLLANNNITVTVAKTSKTDMVAAIKTLDD